LFEFVQGSSGGSELALGLTDVSQVHIALSGYKSNEVQYALKHQTVTDGSVTVTLSDNSTVTFQNIGLLSSKNFATGGMDDGGDHGRHWAHGDRGDHH
jgi:hypothetical protein